ncbi:MAG: hypothetical protein IJW64_00485 [Clostridia bacterium]|nr:hypothetical protein [Clostridia bacterium]
MRQLEKAFNTKDNTKFEMACSAYKVLFDHLQAREHSEVVFGANLQKFKKERYYSVIKPDSGYTFSAVYSNIYEFCEREFGLKKRAVANRIAVAKRFANSDGEVVAEFKEYSFSQLVVLLDVLKVNQNLITRFSPEMKVADMKMLCKAIKKNTFDYLLSNEENIVKINAYLEAEKAGKVEETIKNIESVEEQYEKKDRITAEGEYIPKREDVHINALLEKQEAVRRIKKVFRENEITFFRGNKKATTETVVKYIIKEIYGDEV